MCFLYFIPHLIKEILLLYRICVCYKCGTIEGSIFSRKNVFKHWVDTKIIYKLTYQVLS